MWGDSSYSVYTANLNLTRILAERIYDAHPPLYYYFLHFWSSVVGNSELSVRYLSLFWGVLMVPLGAVMGRKLGGKTLGLVAALLITVSPGLVYYSRFIRMYSLATFLALLSLYLFWQALRRGGRSYWVVYFLVSLAALYTHYYTAFLVVAEALFFLTLLWRQRTGNNLTSWLGTQLALAVFYLPWLAYAGPTQVEKTAFVISQVPAARGLAGFLEQVWVPFNIGVTLDTTVARPLSLAFLPVALVGLVAFWRERTRLSPLLLLLCAAILIPILLSYLLFLIFPFAVRPRFLLIYLPAYLALLAWLVLGWRYIHRILPAMVLVFILASQIYSLLDTYHVERNTLEPTSIMLVQHLEKYAQPGDAVVFHANWQIGYFKGHFRGESVTTYTLEEIKAPLPPSLLSHKRMWLAMLSAGRHDPLYPLERWLDINWVRLGEWQLSENRTILYAQAPGGDWQPAAAEFRDVDDEPALRLAGVRLSSTELTGGEALTVALRWEPAKDLSQRYTVFLHLLDSHDKHVAGHDSEPLAALRPTNEWRLGDVIEDHRGFLTPIDLPRGDYRLVMGLYPTGSPEGLPRLSGVGLSGPGQTAVLGALKVEPRVPSHIKPARNLRATFDGALELFGYETDLDFFQVGHEQLIHPIPDETIRLTFPREAYRRGEIMNLTLYWRSLAKIAEDYRWRLELVDEHNQVQAQAEGTLLRREEPTSAWQEGQVAITQQAMKLDLPVGGYELRFGLVWPASLERASVTANGTESAYLILRQIEVR